MLGYRRTSKYDIVMMLSIHCYTCYIVQCVVVEDHFPVSCLSLVIIQILKSLEPGADMSAVYGADHLLRLFGGLYIL